ncbi:MAG: GspMb/PilO family protein [Gemmatimonadales bacterium]
MNARDRRAIVFGAAVVGLAMLVLKVGPWGWRGAEEAGAELRGRAELLERMSADVRASAMLEDSATVVRSRLAALAPGLLAGGTAAEAAADLGARLAVFAERHRVRVSRTDPVPDSIEGGALVRVAVRAAFESDTRGLLTFLESVGRDPVVLVVEEVRIAVADPFVRRDRPELLHTELVVRAWFMPAKRSS